MTQEVRIKKSVQNIIPITNIYNNGVIKSNDKLIQIVEIKPINFSLKSDMEKCAILEKFKILLKTCNFDFQTIIITQKQDIESQIKSLKEKMEQNFKFSKNYLTYIDFLQNLSNSKESKIKKFYIVISLGYNNSFSKELNFENLESQISQLTNCIENIGNNYSILNTKKETLKLLKEIIS